MSKTIKLTMLIVAMFAFLVGCGMAGTQKNKTDKIFVLLNRSAVPVAATDLMDITFVASTPSAPAPNMIIGPKEDVQPIYVMSVCPFERRTPFDPLPTPTAFFPPRTIRFENNRSEVRPSQPLTPLLALACLLAFIVSVAVRMPKQCWTGLKNTTFVVVTAALCLFSFVIGLHLLPVIMGYLGLRGIVLIGERAINRADQAVANAIEYIGFLLVPSFAPNWMSQEPHATPSVVAAQAPTSAPVVQIDVPAAWQGDRPLHESWSDDEDEPAKPAAGKLDHKRSLMILAALMRTQTLRREFEAKVAELAEMEDMLRQLASMDETE